MIESETSSEQRLLDMSPPQFANLKQMQAIAKSEGVQFDKLDVDIDELFDQGFIKTATWSLPFWERRFLLPVLNQNIDLEERRNRVLAAKRSIKDNLIEMLRVIEPSIELAWCGLTLAFIITFDSSEPYDLSELLPKIEKEKPSHLNYSFRFQPYGYTVLANKAGRNQVALQPMCGTTRARMRRNIEIEGGR